MIARVLLVEDDPDLALICATALGVAGIDVVSAGSVGEAISASVEADPVVAIVDLQLPDGTGWDFVSWARATRPGMRMLICSVHADAPENLERLRSWKVDAVVPKTGDPNALVGPVKALLEA